MLFIQRCHRGNTCVPLTSLAYHGCHRKYGWQLQTTFSVHLGSNWPSIFVYWKFQLLGIDTCLFILNFRHHSGLNVTEVCSIWRFILHVSIYFGDVLIPRWCQAINAINSLWPSNTIWRQRSGSALAQIMVSLPMLKPLLEPMSTSYPSCSVAFTWEQFCKCTWTNELMISNQTRACIH